MYAYVGCRTTKERGATGKGLAVFALDEPGAPWRQIQLVEGLANPSFLAMGRTGEVLYTVHGDFSEVSALRVDRRTGLLTLLNRQSTGGRNPVHLAVNRRNTTLVVANYATGSVASLPITADGSLGAPYGMVTLPGPPGPHRTDQGGSHPHQILPCPYGLRDGEDRFVVPDKGLDTVFVLRLADDGRLKLEECLRMQSRPGAGPRHAVFHPHRPVLYVVNELDSSITTAVIDGDSAALQPVQVLPTLPPDFFGSSTGASIVITPSGRFVYVTNRGHDSVAAFAVEADHRLRSVGWVPTLGSTPRFMTLDPSAGMLLVANETSSSIQGFHIDEVSGMLTPADLTIETGSPVCILFAGR